jgi:putative ABC transport system permease protein
VIGRRVRIGRTEDVPELEIVGVAADARSSPTSTEIWNEIYVPYAQRAPSITYLLVGSDLAEPELTAAVTSVVREVAPALPAQEGRRARSLDEIVHESLDPARFSAALSVAFSLTALLLAAIGVFGLISYTVAERRKDLAIRSALGARPAHLAETALSPVLLATVLGLVAGATGAAWLSRFVAPQLYGVEALDAATFASAAALCLLVSVAAALVPARRAARTDSARVLRED